MTTTERLRLDDHDALTGLLCRQGLLATLFRDAGSPTAGVVRSPRQPLTGTGGVEMLLVLDHDDFGQLNARLGHDVGDLALMGVADRLRGSVRATDLVARLSGDRFAVHAIVADRDEGEAFARRLGRLFTEPFSLDGRAVPLWASIGVALVDATDDTCGASGILERAERALRGAQVRGGRRISFGGGDDDGPAEWHDDERFARAAHAALVNGHVHVAYQPIVELSSGRLRKVEALARWTDPVLGEIPSSQFIGLAERAGVIDEVGEFVLRRACADIASLDGVLGDVALCVNCSVVQLRDPRVTQRVARALADAGMPADRLWIEVTESVLVDEAALAPLRALHALGVHLVIDDFGTGYASLQYLTRLPVSALKIDMGFVRGLGVDASDTAIVRSVVNLGRELGLQVVAEGVETESQRAQLVALNCRLGQGWLFDRALALDELARVYARPARHEPQSPADEVARLDALIACRVLDTEAEHAFDSLVRLAAQLLETPMAAVSLIDADRQWFKAQVGLDVPETPRNVAFCAHAIQTPEDAFVVPDAATDPRFACNPLVTGDPHIRSYAGIPIVTRDHHALGTLCVIDTVTRDFTGPQLSVLRSLAQQASALLDLRRRAAELNDMVRLRHEPITSVTALGTPDHRLGTALVEHAAELVLVLDRHAVIRYANPAATTMLGHAPADWVGRSGLELVHPDDLPDARRALEDVAVHSGSHLPHRLRVARADGTWCHVEMVANNLISLDGVNGIVLNARDVSEQQQFAEQLSQQRQISDATLDNLDEGVLACDAQGRLTVFNVAARRITRQPGRSIPAHEWAAAYGLLTADGSRLLETHEVPLYRALLGERIHDVEIVIAPQGSAPRTVRCNGQQLRESCGRVLGAVVTMSDVTGQREIEARLHHQARHDQLTGLRNRHELLPHLERLIEIDPSDIAVAFIDLDRLKEVNDVHGHRAGDQLLERLARHLDEIAQDGEVTARIGGDEFAIVRRRSACDDHDDAWAARVRDAVRFTALLRGRPHAMTASCGFAVGRAGDTSTTLLARADAAMYAEKRLR